MNAKKIFLITSALKDGGAEKIFCWLVQSLENCGYDVQVFSLSGNEEHCNFQHPVFFLPWRNGMISYWEVVKVMRGEIRKAQPDVVLGWSLFSNLVAAYSVLGSGCHPRIICNERSRVSSLLDMPSPFKKMLLKLLVRYGYQKADSILCNSKSAAEDLKNKFHISGAKVFCVDNPVDIEHIRSLAQDMPEAFKNAARPVIVSVARLSAEKGHGELLSAFAMIPRERRGTLLIVGDGPERENLQNKIAALGLQKDVILSGRISEPYAYMHYADLLVLSSHYEGFPNVVLEGMAAGAAVVATKCCNHIERFAQSGVCVSAEVGSAESLHQAMEYALLPENNRNLRKKASEAVKEYDSEKIIAQYVKFVD